MVVLGGIVFRGRVYVVASAAPGDCQRSSIAVFVAMMPRVDRGRRALPAPWPRRRARRASVRSLSCRWEHGVVLVAVVVSSRPRALLAVSCVVSISNLSQLFHDFQKKLGA